MTSETTITKDSRPVINPLYMFRWEEQEQAYLLLYPEGIVKLNDSAGHIMKHCNGERAVSEVIDVLEQEFNHEGLSGDVFKFMEVAHAKGWIRINA